MSEHNPERNPKAGPNQHPTGPTDPDEFELLKAELGDPDEAGRFHLTLVDEES